MLSFCGCACGMPLVVSGSPVALQRDCRPPPGSWPKMIVSPSYENAAEWPVGLSTFGAPARDLRDHVVVEEARVVARAAVLAADAPDREADAAGAGDLVRAAEDDAGVVAGEAGRRPGRPAGELEAQELGLLGPAQRHLDDVEALARARSTACRRPAAGGCPRSGTRGQRVRAARQVDAGDELRVLRVADVEDVHALEADRDGLAVAGLVGARVRVPRADEDAAPDDDVALAAGRVPHCS